jgi:YfiH family protein
LFLHYTSTTSHGNLSYKWGEHEEVLCNREVFLSEHNLKLENCIALKTQDKDVIQVADQSFKGRGMHNFETGVVADALITQEKNLFLFLLTADCLPISFYDPKKEVVGLAHLSWRTTDLKLVQKVIDTFVSDFQSQPGDIMVNIGPGIHKESYVLDAVAQENDEKWQPFILKTNDGQSAIDIVGYNCQQLIEKGVIPHHITVSQHDTYISQDYFSHYRSVRTREPEGRFATVIGMKD